MARIFISYRREDTAAYAGRLYDRLAAKFGVSNVFIDIDNIELGLDFVQVIQDTVGSCDVVIALIGKNWLNAVDEEGRRRLDQEDDAVRLEIATALARNIRVIPAFVEGARMPRQPELPAALGPLTRRNGIPISHERFHQDVERLTTALERALTKTADLTAPRPVEPAKPAPAPIAPSVPRVITRAAGPVLGIDFGFSNLVAAVIKDGPPLVVQDSPGRRSTPAMIATSKQGLIMGLAAKKQAILHPAETATSVPGLLLGTEEVRLGAIRHSPIDLAARLLSDLRKTAEQFASAKFVRTVVTVSPRFTATNALEQACREANLPNYELVPEPIAVVRACLDEHHQDGEFMVCHMGGAASWVAAVSADAGELSARAHLATQQPAGADFDRRIIEWICADFQRTHRIDLSRDPMAMQRLVEAAERTKILLSGIEQTEINLAFLAADASGPKHLVTRLDRSQFNKLTQSVLAEFIAFCRNFASRHTPPGKISVIVSGGMMRSPAVFGAVGELFRQNPLMPVPPEEAAALGAVMMAAAGSGVSHTGASG